jgi:hypothetical protein
VSSSHSQDDSNLSSSQISASDIDSAYTDTDTQSAIDYDDDDDDDDDDDAQDDFDPDNPFQASQQRPASATRQQSQNNLHAATYANGAGSAVAPSSPTAIANVEPPPPSSGSSSFANDITDHDTGVGVAPARRASIREMSSTESRYFRFGLEAPAQPNVQSSDTRPAKPELQRQESLRELPNPSYHVPDEAGCCSVM